MAQGHLNMASLQSSVDGRYASALANALAVETDSPLHYVADRRLTFEPQDVERNFRLGVCLSIPLCVCLFVCFRGA